jgi:hypothetical protein
MRRIVFGLLVAGVLSSATATAAHAAFYVGGGKGIKVAFRVRGDKVIAAAVTTRLYCKREESRLSRHFRKGYASPDYPLRLNARGVFSWDTTGRRQEESFTQEEFLSGHVGPKFVVGRFGYYESRSYEKQRLRCQTGSYPFGDYEVKFRARRRS